MRKITPRTLWAGVWGLSFAFVAGSTQKDDDPARDARLSSTTSLQREHADSSSTVERSFFSGLVGSKHDFGKGEHRPRDLCLPCHAPHLPSAVVPRYDRRPAATQPIRPYQSVESDLDRGSLICLSCHDGIIASDVYTPAHATVNVAEPSAEGADRRLLRGHPVGIRYPANAEGYHPLTVVTATSSIRLPDGRIQCISCHDPHNRGQHAGMLVQSNERSRLCLACHRL